MPDEDEGARSTGVDSELFEEAFPALVQPDQVIDRLADRVVDLSPRNPGASVFFYELGSGIPFQLDHLKGAVAANQRDVDLVARDQSALFGLADDPPAEYPVHPRQGTLQCGLGRGVVFDHFAQSAETGGPALHFRRAQHGLAVLVHRQNRQSLGRGDYAARGFGRVRHLDPVAQHTLGPESELGRPPGDAVAGRVLLRRLHEAGIFAHFADVVQDVLQGGVGVIDEVLFSLHAPEFEDRRCSS